MLILRLVTGIYQENCFIVADENSRHGIIIDPGDEADRILAAVKEHNLRITKIVNTHGHVDHIGAVDEIKKALGVPFFIHRADEKLVAWAKPLVAGLMYKLVNAPKIDGFLKESDTVEVGSHTARVIHTPGHTQGGVCLYFEPENAIFVGDTLFQGSIGRTDLPGGNTEQLLTAIKTKLLVIPDDTVCYCGHGEETTIGDEKRFNPFL
ncbi:MAG: MBL fold metallo-hydrolase [bacterium]